MSDDGFHGVFPYLVSPIGEDGTVLDEPLSHLVERVIAAGDHGLTPLGNAALAEVREALERVETL